MGEAATLTARTSTLAGGEGATQTDRAAADLLRCWRYRFQKGSMAAPAAIMILSEPPGWLATNSAPRPSTGVGNCQKGSCHECVGYSTAVCIASSSLPQPTSALIPKRHLPPSYAQHPCVGLHLR